jgi:hypothetical protein
MDVEGNQCSKHPSSTLMYLPHQLLPEPYLDIDQTIYTKLSTRRSLLDYGPEELEQQSNKLSM